MYQTIRVIIADDHELLRKGFPILLRKQNEIQIIDEAENGRELVEKVRRHQPDIVITDIEMPIMDGIKATQAIKAEFPDVGILALTMFNDDNLIVKMLESGARGYLLKNTNQKELTEAIKAVYNGGTYFCQSTSDSLKRLIATSAFNPYKKAMKAEFTDKEIEIMRYICQELSNKEIAEKMSLSVRTVESYRERIFEKTNSKTVAGITIYAIKHEYYKI